MGEIKKFKPATNITDAYNAVNPDESLEPGDQRYVDFTEWRGNEYVTKIIAEKIARSKSGQYLKQLVTGHRGCGKTTELLLLKKILENKGYFVIYFDSTLEIDMNDVDYADILLTTMYKLEEEIRKNKPDIKLNQAKLEDMALRLAKKTINKEDRREIEKTFESDFNLGAEIPFFSKVMLALRSYIKSGSTYKNELRIEIKQRASLFLEDLNDLINQVQSQLQNKEYRGLVIIIDSLDRIIPNIVDEKTKKNTHTAIYFDHAEHLKTPQCHIVYTVPISICYNQNLNTVYSDRPLVVPMIKIYEKDGKVSKAGISKMREAIYKRIDVEKVFEDKKSLDKLCLMSGGHLRDLLHLVRYACDYSEDKISEVAVSKAINALVNEYDMLVKDKDLERLVTVHNEKRLPSDSEYELLPYHLIVLEYQNDERWADVHPAVKETRKFREALRNEVKNTKKKNKKSSHKAK
jgi:energy-coupling factor transporter ATP-binding protein EcfA2